MIDHWAFIHFLVFSLEEYLEILFLQARDLIVADTEQTGWRVHLAAWLDDDRQHVQSSQVRFVTFISLSNVVSFI